MKVITKYQATDGTEWDSAKECEERDRLDTAVRVLEERLGPRVESGRRAIDPMLVAEVKALVIRLARDIWPNEGIWKHDPSKIHAFSYAGRFLDDAGGPLNRIWSKLMCINSDWYYEQPYFALHPDMFQETHK